MLSQQTRGGGCNQCCFNVDPLSSTLARHWNSIGWLYRVCWYVDFDIRDLKWSRLCITCASVFLFLESWAYPSKHAKLRQFCFCWASVAYRGPTIHHHWLDVVYILGFHILISLSAMQYEVEYTALIQSVSPSISSHLLYCRAKAKGSIF